MAMFHVHARVISKGKSPGGSTGFAQYIAREQSDKATQQTRYLERGEGYAKDDLVATGSGGLPRWAQDGAHFFVMADRYERKGATVARCYAIALPRELSPEARLDLAQDIRETFFARYPHAWAVHCPLAHDQQQAPDQTQDQPHMHLIMSERGNVDGIERSPKQYFARAAGPEQDPATHGVRKDRSWQGPGRLRGLRAGIATLTNAALERAGLEVAVSHESLRARGHKRAPEKDQGRGSAVLMIKHGDQAPDTIKAAWGTMLAERKVLRKQYHPWENELNRAAWYEQKQRDHIRDVSREAVIDYVRDRFWRHDRSPAREQEREASLMRALDREYARTGRERAQAPAVEQTRERQPQRRTSVPLAVGLDDAPHGGIQVRLHDREQEVEYGR